MLEGRHEYAIVDGNLSHDSVGEICDRIGARGILGISAMPGPQVADALTVTREVRDRNPDAVIIWGGYFATQRAEVCLREPAIDYVLKGCGEHAFLQFVDGVREGHVDLDEVAGLCYRSERGSTDLLAPPSYEPDRRPRAGDSLLGNPQRRRTNPYGRSLLGR